MSPTGENCGAFDWVLSISFVWGETQVLVVREPHACRAEELRRCSETENVTSKQVALKELIVVCPTQNKSFLFVFLSACWWGHVLLRYACCLENCYYYFLKRNCMTVFYWWQTFQIKILLIFLYLFICISSFVAWVLPQSFFMCNRRGIGLLSVLEISLFLKSMTVLTPSTCNKQQ